MAQESPSDPAPKRVEEFARFFKRYMSISSVVAAALPIPITSLKLIPTFAAQTTSLTTYTSMYCFLALGFVFYSRHALAPRMFGAFSARILAPAYESPSEQRPISAALSRAIRGLSELFVPMLPLVLIACAIGCMLVYHTLFEFAFSSVRRFKTVEETLKAPLDAIPYAAWLQLSYIGFFMFAEAAFIVMAIKEYLQDLLGFTDRMILGIDEPPPEYRMRSSAAQLSGSGWASSGELRSTEDQPSG